MFEGVDWVFGGSFDGWVDAENDANDEGCEEGDKNNLPTDKWGKWSNGGEDEGENVGEDEAKNAAEKRED